MEASNEISNQTIFRSYILYTLEKQYYSRPTVLDILNIWIVRRKKDTSSGCSWLWVEVPRNVIYVHRKVGFEKKRGIAASELKMRFPGTSLVAQWIRLHTPNAGGPRSIPGQGTRSCMLQLRICMPQLRSLHAATKTACNQINKYFF